MRWRRGSGGGSGDEFVFGEEEGESMVGFDFERAERRVRGGEVSEAVVAGGGERVWGEEMDSQRRLSRDLEEGFKDDSEDEEGGGDDRRR